MPFSRTGYRIWGTQCKMEDTMKDFQMVTAEHHTKWERVPVGLHMKPARSFR